MTTTIRERIDIALSQAQLSKHGLADTIGVSRQAIYALSRRPKSTLSPEHLAKAARAMRCDLYWLCTGDGGQYVPAQTEPFSYIATEAAKLLDGMCDVERERAFVVVFRLAQGQWPVGFKAHASPEAADGQSAP